MTLVFLTSLVYPPTKKKCELEPSLTWIYLAHYLLIK